MEIPLLRRPAIFAPFPEISSGESTRHGGISPAPFATLNLGKSTGDAPENVAENRRRFFGSLGFLPEQSSWSFQVHGDKIRAVETPGGLEGCDAMICRTPGIVLAVSVADCTPILVFDSKNKAVAAVHAGWRGTVAGIVEKTLVRMVEDFGTMPGHCFAWVGTCIDECSFEVGDEVAAEFAPTFRRFDVGRGRFFVDLKKANAAQLLAFGIPPGQIGISPFSTILNNDDYFSHRAENGTTGRMMAAIGLKTKSL